MNTNWKVISSSREVALQFLLFSANLLIHTYPSLPPHYISVKGKYHISAGCCCFTSHPNHLHLRQQIRAPQLVPHRTIRLFLRDPYKCLHFLIICKTRLLVTVCTLIFQRIFLKQHLFLHARFDCFLYTMLNPLQCMDCRFTSISLFITLLNLI